MPCRANATINKICILTRSHDTGVASLLDLKEAAEAMGLAAETARLDPSRPIPWKLPMILYLREGHFTAILPIESDRLVFADPPDPPRVRDRHWLAGDWEGVSLIVAPDRTLLRQALSKAGLREESQ